MAKSNKAKVTRGRKKVTKEIDIDVKKIDTPKVVKKLVADTKVKKVLYAVDSFEQDARIEADSKDPMKKVTVMVMAKFSKANVDKYLRSGDLRLIDTFSSKFQEEDFDVAFVEKAMMEFVPAHILKKLNS